MQRAGTRIIQPRILLAAVMAGAVMAVLATLLAQLLGVAASPSMVGGVAVGAAAAVAISCAGRAA